MNGPLDTYSHSTRGHRNRRAGEEGRSNVALSRTSEQTGRLPGAFSGFENVKAVCIGLTNPQK